MKTIFVLIIVLFLLGCQSEEPQQNKGRSGPQTFYGETVERAKGISNELGERDKAIAEQAEMLFEEE